MTTAPIDIDEFQGSSFGDRIILKALDATGGRRRGEMKSEWHRRILLKAREIEAEEPKP